MVGADGLVVMYTRPLGDHAGWDEWCRDEHLRALRDLAGVRAATRFALVPAGLVGGPGPGFTHVELVEVAGPVDAGAGAVAALVARERSAGRHDHAVVRGETLVAHGRHAKPVPDEGLRGHVVADVVCADRRRESEWDRWYDDQHLPDMVATGAFSAGSRWRRLRRPLFGATHVTVYDVADCSVAEAVQRSAAAMPGLIAAGRKHPTHCGGATLALERAE